jgi:hypothetical protein
MEQLPRDTIAYIHHDMLPVPRELLTMLVPFVMLPIVETWMLSHHVPMSITTSNNNANQMSDEVYAAS